MIPLVPTVNWKYTNGVMQLEDIHSLLKDLKKDNEILRAEIIELRESGASKTSTFPETIRLPKSGTRCPHSGLSRTGLFRLYKSGKVRTKVLKTDPNNKTGTRLIVGSSLFAFLNRVPDEIAA